MEVNYGLVESCVDSWFFFDFENGVFDILVVGFREDKGYQDFLVFFLEEWY